MKSYADANADFYGGSFEYEVDSDEMMEQLIQFAVSMGPYDSLIHAIQAGGAVYDFLSGYIA